MVLLTPRQEPLPEDTEARLADFTQLLPTAIANAESREARAMLTEEQAALRRVAALVAQGVPSDALFRAVCDEVEALAGVDGSVVLRFEADGTATVMGVHGGRDAVDARHELEPAFVVAQVHRTGRAHGSTRTTRRRRACPRSSGRSGSSPRSRARSSSRASSGV